MIKDITDKTSKLALTTMKIESKKLIRKLKLRKTRIKVGNGPKLLSWKRQKSGENAQPTNRIPEQSDCCGEGVRHRTLGQKVLWVLDADIWGFQPRLLGISGRIEANSDKK